MDLTPEELQRIGQYTVNMAGVMVALGHQAATGTTVYVAPNPEDPMSGFVVDMFLACVPGEEDRSPRDRIQRFVEDHGVLDLIAEAVTR